MTGAEHYAEAERLINQTNALNAEKGTQRRAQLLTEAQVHATLALADAQPMTWHVASTFVEATNSEYPPLFATRPAERDP